MGKRFVADIPVNQPAEIIDFVMKDFFEKEGFVSAEYQGERVWKKGVGMMTAPQFIKVQTYPGGVHVEAWLKYAILPGVYAGEMGTSGFLVAIPKKMLRDRVEALINLISQPGLSQPIDGFVEKNETIAKEDAPPAAVKEPTAVPVYVHDTSNKAALSLAMGLISIVGLFIPLIGVVTGIIGIVMAVPGLKSVAKSKAIAGLTLSIIFLLASLIVWTLNMIALL